MWKVKQSDWTDERVELLKQLAAKGYSASRIAAEIGGITRNAVIGKLSRLGLSLSGARTAAGIKPTERASGQRVRRLRGYKVAAARPPAAEDVMTKKPSKAEDQDDSLHETDGALVRSAALFVCDPAEPTLSLMELTDQTCKWPFDVDGGYRFCGKQTGYGPYCDYHANCSTTPAMARRRTAPIPSYRGR